MIDVDEVMRAYPHQLDEQGRADMRELLTVVVHAAEAGSGRGVVRFDDWQLILSTESPRWQWQPVDDAPTSEPVPASVMREVPNQLDADRALVAAARQWRESMREQLDLARAAGSQTVPLSSFALAFGCDLVGHLADAFAGTLP